MAVNTTSKDTENAILTRNVSLKKRHPTLETFLLKPKNDGHSDKGARNLNPVPYTAAYVGHKLHMDQNEKLVMFGVTHVLAIDGFSSKIVGRSTMPVKNNLTIYNEVYRSFKIPVSNKKSAIMEHGMWDQVRVDHGKEFYLTLFMQEKLASQRHNTERPPYRQTPSTKNHTIERIWPEINNRVNYPLKLALIQLVDQEELDMEDNMSKYCVSSLTCQLAQLGVERAVQAWNAHRIPGKGIPNYLAREGCPKRVEPDLLPVASVAADWYDQEVGRLTRESHFGTNPFHNAQDQEAAEREFGQQLPDVSFLLDNAVNNQPEHFKHGLKCLVDVTRRHSQC
ncbi:uncharacterized protein LOC117559009 [Gymnodraco acuticeps]|uniref:Uncharacterized protein LOC117559009 n=1 Tax=Gymnodraco acuticeps TaxID=8218 RepID=A0A6P8VZY5_GYMAC|nr:uncharacterized protein LOC117559009 [Gymnodraco acuticeps]